MRDELRKWYLKKKIYCSNDKNKYFILHLYNNEGWKNIEIIYLKNNQN